MDSDRLQPRLHAYLSADPRWAGARPQALRFLARGWESEIYLQEFENGEALVLRIYPAADAQVKSAREHHALELLHQAGYPVPEVFALELDASILDRPFVLMEYIPGEQMWPLIDREQEQVGQTLLGQFSRLLADLHQLDWRQFTPERPADPADWLLRWLAGNRGELEYFHLDGFLPVLDWLTARAVDITLQPPAPVHWDFHPGNVLISPAGRLVVVDWTQFTVSDARFDLAWTLLLLGAYEGDRWRTTVLTEYERYQGAPVQDLVWFDAAVATKRLGHMVVALTASPEVTGMMGSAADAMRAQFPAYRWIYTLFQERTGLRLAEVETILEL